MGDTPPIGSISEVGSVLLKKTMVWKSGGGQNRREIDMDVVERTPMDSDSDEVPAPPFPPKMMRKSSISLKVVMAEVDGGGPTASKVKGKGKEKAQPPPEYSATEPNAEIACVKSRPKVEAIQSGHPYVSQNQEFLSPFWKHIIGLFHLSSHYILNIYTSSRHPSKHLEKRPHSGGENVEISQLSKVFKTPF